MLRNNADEPIATSEYDNIRANPGYEDTTWTGHILESFQVVENNILNMTARTRNIFMVVICLILCCDIVLPLDGDTHCMRLL